MDLIAALSSQLGLDTNNAQSLAGAALGSLEEQVSQKLGGGDAAALQASIPELPEWKAKAEALGFGGAGGSSAGGGLLGAATSLLGGGGGGSGFDIAALVQLASKAGLGPAAAQQLLPLVLQFLKSRLDPALLSKIASAVPALKGASGGGLAGALGGILGG